jgi:TetR/AcrR family tetracycline transcriptional repressor
VNRDEKIAHDLARIEQAHQQSKERLKRTEERIHQRFDRARQHILKRHGVTSDSQQRIITAALDLLSTEGLSNLSLRKLASALDMQAPALYWHFKNKEVLIDYLAEAILQSEFKNITPRSPDEPWQDWLINHMLRLRKAMLTYPDGGRIVAGAHLYPAITLAKIFETTLASLMSAGLNAELTHTLALTSTHYTFGTVIEEQSAPTPEQLASTDLIDLFADMPHLRDSAEDFGKRMSDPNTDPDAQFIAGLSLIIQGAAAQM